jgi:hypothetical protein
LRRAGLILLALPASACSVGLGTSLSTGKAGRDTLDRVAMPFADPAIAVEAAPVSSSTTFFTLRSAVALGYNFGASVSYGAGLTEVRARSAETSSERITADLSDRFAVALTYRLPLPWTLTSDAYFEFGQSMITHVANLGGPEQTYEAGIQVGSCCVSARVGAFVEIGELGETQSYAAQGLVFSLALHLSGNGVSLSEAK